jgi:hypothetical protein
VFDGSRGLTNVESTDKPRQQRHDLDVIAQVNCERHEYRHQSTGSLHCNVEVGLTAPFKFARKFDSNVRRADLIKSSEALELNCRLTFIKYRREKGI